MDHATVLLLMCYTVAALLLYIAFFSGKNDE